MFKSVAYIGLALLLLNAAKTSVYAAEISAKQVEAAEQKAHARQMAHKKLQAQAVQLSLEMAKMNKKMIAAARQLQDDEEKTTRMEEELQLLENKLKITQEEFSREYANLAQILASLENMALHPTESLLVQPLSPVEVIRSAILLRESVPYLNDKAEKIKQDLENIAAQKKKVEQKLKELASQKASLLKQQKNIKKMSAEKAAVRKKIEGESAKVQQEAQKLAAEASDLRDLMEKLEHDKEIQRRRQEEIRRAARERALEEQRRLEEEQQRRIAAAREGEGLAAGEEFAPADDEMTNVDLININPQSIKKNSLNFAGAKGKLTRPARGAIVTSYGQELSKGVTAKGIVFKTRASAQIISPYDGSVIFSGPFKGYGNLIIIDHGQGYVSLLAGMSSVDAEIGQMVLAGEPVGVMPDVDSPKLYMEIRKDQRPVNPAPWLGG